MRTSQLVSESGRVALVRVLRRAGAGIQLSEHLISQRRNAAIWVGTLAALGEGQ